MVELEAKKISAFRPERSVCLWGLVSNAPSPQSLEICKEATSRAGPSRKVYRKAEEQKKKLFEHYEMMKKRREEEELRIEEAVERMR